MNKTIYPVNPQAVANAKAQIDQMYIDWQANRKKRPKVEFGHAKQKRTNPQNNLQHKWYAEMAEQDETGMTALDYRCYCKLHFGLPILCEDPAKAEMIHEKIYSLPYERQLDVMGKPPFPEFEVTRMMTVDQKKRFLHDVHYFWAVENGYRLTQPVEKY